MLCANPLRLRYQRCVALGFQAGANHMRDTAIALVVRPAQGQWNNMLVNEPLAFIDRLKAYTASTAMFVMRL